MSTAEAITHGIRVRVESQYIPERSDPDRNLYFFAYLIQIANEGEETVQLISRHWVITDATGLVEEVRGPGVVGEQPVIEPRRYHEYTSFCPLKTSAGSMQGTYRMITDQGEEFDVKIPPFSLSFRDALLH